MIEKLSQKEKRTLKISAVCAAAILAFAFGTKWLGRWRQARESLAEIRGKLEVINVAPASAGVTGRAGLLSIVPAFEMPRGEEEQKFLFRDKFNEQLKKVGIKSEPLQVLPTGRTRLAGGYKLLRVKCSGKCKFGQILDLLAGLNENPYLVGIEEMRIKCDAKNRHVIELDLTVSTFVK